MAQRPRREAITWIPLLVIACGCHTAPASGPAAPPIKDNPATTVPPDGPAAAEPRANAVAPDAALPSKPVAHRAAAVRGAEHHGQCCKTNAECGGIPCAPYEFANSSCAKVCTIPC